MVVVGGGQAAGRAVEAMRGAGFAGPIVVVGAERHPPYERPPLSKAVLIGDAEPETCAIHPPAYYRDNDIALRLGVRATAIDRGARRLALDDGETLAYDRLLLATGSVVRRLAVPGADHPRVRTLRDIADALAIRARLSVGARIVVIGGGYLGLEVAAAARLRGAEVTVLEAQDRVLCRGVTPEVAAFVAALHRRHGVVLRTGVGIERFEGGSEGVRVRLAGGEALDADLVFVGIGVAPAVALAEAAGLAVGDGIVVDVCGRTSDPVIFAAGDVTDHPSPRLGRRVRLESWANAQNQAIAAARSMCGIETVYDALPWFWTDQYEVSLQLVGLPERWDRTVLRGAMNEGRFIAFYLDRGRVVGAAAAGLPREAQIARRLIEAGCVVAPDRLADEGLALRAILKEGRSLSGC